MKELSDEQALKIMDLATFEANVVFSWRGVVYRHGDYDKFIRERDSVMYLNIELDEDSDPSIM